MTPSTLAGWFARLLETTLSRGWPYLGTMTTDPGAAWPLADGGSPFLTGDKVTPI
jgi:hypothetical protein